MSFVNLKSAKPLMTQKTCVCSCECCATFYDLAIFLEEKESVSLSR